nr:MAG TPA: hypothetical protein [Caudoviricetes sp.]
MKVSMMICKRSLTGNILESFTTGNCIVNSCCV